MEIIARNRKAYFQYEILEKFEAGIILTGTEVKSVRNKDVSINESFAHINNGEVFPMKCILDNINKEIDKTMSLNGLGNCYYTKREINKIIGKIKQKGYTMIPLALYFKEGLIKAEIALVRGKSIVDKREDIKKRTVEREIQRAMR